MKRGLVLATLILVGSLSVAVMGFQGPPAGQGAAPRGGGPGGAPAAGAAPGGQRGPAPPAQLATIKVRDNLHMVTGGGGNTAIFVQTNGVTLVDTKLANNGQGILDQVRAVTNKPITMIINTHTHGDHNGSNEFFTDNVAFVAHENTKANMEKMPAFAGDKAKFIPTRTYKDTMTIGTGADQIVLYYFGAAHTNGDTFVVFPALRAMHSGDAFATKGLPNVDAANGGSLVEYGKTLAKAASTIKNVDTIINGHITTGPTPFADLQVYADFNNELLAYVQNSVKANKTLDQAAAEYKFPEKYAGYTAPPAIGQRGGPDGVIRTGYVELGAPVPPAAAPAGGAPGGARGGRGQ
jgi:glyoxylase-like metal-dependent hydrolase (beta-lactamase superfamily II)